MMNIKSITSITQIQEVLTYFKNHEVIAYDSETTGQLPDTSKIILYQLGDSETQFVINEEAVPISTVRELLESKEVIFQNASFDLQFLYWNKIYPEKIYDTLVVESCITAGDKARKGKLGLDYIVNKYCGVSLDKSIRGDIHRLGASHPSVIEYAGKDVAYLHEVREKQLAYAQEHDLTNWINNENKTIPAIATMRFNKLPFNKEKWQARVDKDTIDLGRKLIKLTEMAAQEERLSPLKSRQIGLWGAREFELEWNSPLQVQRAFKLLGVSEGSVEERIIKKYQNKEPIIKAYIDYKKAEKLVSSFGEGIYKFMDPNTGRMNSSIWQVVHTSRMSASDINYMQLPKKDEFRNPFECKDGYVIVQSDYKQQELRVAAAASQETVWLEAFEMGKDIHASTAMAVFGVREEEVNSKPEKFRGKSYRDIAKTINFGIL